MLKRIFDLALTLLGLLLLSPLFLIVGLLVYARLGRPVIFKQVRPGLHGEPYTMYKFRSMTNEKDKDGNLLPNEERLTSFGQKLRSTSLDELPELINVLKGDMSLVGPRPLKMQYLSRYSEEQYRRHEVKPGITGWAQIHGRNKVDWQERFKMDVWYVDNRSLWLDIRIIVKTLGTVLSQEGVSPEENLIAKPFQGNEKEINNKMSLSDAEGRN